MDKLEKALQKAREMRKGVGGDTIARTAAPASLPESRIALTDEVLESHRIVAHRTQSAEADTFRILRTQVLQTMARHGLRTLAVTSAHYGEGKTTVSINLSLSIALDQKQTVLLADLDLRKPNVHEYLGIDAARGLTDCLAGQADVAACLVRLPYERLTVLPAGSRLEHSSETLGSPRMGALADELKSRYVDRMIVYDMPPLLDQDDPLAFLPHVDGVLLVVQDGVTTAADVRRCLSILEQARVVGIVLNNVM